MPKYAHVLIALLALSLSLVACDKEEQAEPEAADQEAQVEQAEPEAAEAEAADQDQAEDEELEMVEVSDEGVEFDPAVEKEQIPEGAWYCDMGTVHWAQMEEGDATCELCSMKLKQKGAHDAHADQDGHEGHDHD